MTRFRRFARAGAAVLAAVALAVAIPAPASALPPDVFVTQGWVYTLSGGGTSLFTDVTPNYPDFAGPGQDVAGWPMGELPLPGLRSLLGSPVGWGPYTISQVGDEVTIVTTLGGYPATVKVVGPVAVYSIDFPERTIINDPWLYFDAVSAGATILTAADNASRWRFDAAVSRSAVGAFQLGPQTEWAAFVDVDLGLPRYLVIPVGPNSPTIPAGTTVITQVLVGAPPCLASRDARLAALAAALPAAPTTAQQLAELTCDTSLGAAALVSGGSSVTPLVVPPSIVANGWLSDPSLLRASFDGLPAGVTAELDTSGPVPAVRLSGSAAPGDSVVSVRLWRDFGEAPLREPLVGELTLTVSGAALAATGSVPTDGVPIAVLLLAVGIAAVALARVARRRRAVAK